MQFINKILGLNKDIHYIKDNVCYYLDKRKQSFKTSKLTLTDFETIIIEKKEKDLLVKSFMIEISKDGKISLV